MNRGEDLRRGVSRWSLTAALGLQLPPSYIRIEANLHSIFNLRFYFLAWSQHFGVKNVCFCLFLKNSVFQWILLSLTHFYSKKYILCDGPPQTTLKSRHQFLEQNILTCIKSKRNQEVFYIHWSHITHCYKTLNAFFRI